MIYHLKHHLVQLRLAMNRPAIFNWAAPVGTNGGAGESKGDDDVDMSEDDVVDVVNDEIPDEVLDRLDRPESERIALRAYNDRAFSDYYTFKREEIDTSVHYFLSLDDADFEEVRKEVEKVLDAFKNLDYTITKDKESNPRTYTAWNPRRTVRGLF